MRKMTKAGNRVVFDDDEGDHIMNNATGRRTPIENKNGAYVFNMWTNKSEGHGKHVPPFGRRGTA